MLARKTTVFALSCSPPLPLPRSRLLLSPGFLGFFFVLRSSGSPLARPSLSFPAPGNEKFVHILYSARSRYPPPSPSLSGINPALVSRREDQNSLIYRRAASPSAPSPPPLARLLSPSVLFSLAPRPFRSSSLFVSGDGRARGAGRGNPSDRARAKKRPRRCASQ